MTITLDLDQNQIGLRTISLTDAQLASIHRQESAPPTTPPSSATEMVVPLEVSGRSIRHTRMPWSNGAPRTIVDLDDSSAWAITFTPGPFATGSFRGAQWQQQACDRHYRLVRNRDGVVIASSPGFGVVSVGINFTASAPHPRSGLVQLFQDEPYTLVIWNKLPTPPGSGRMFMELYVQQ